MKTIYLHIGKHKTGTTSIQHYLKENKDYFEKNNFHIVTVTDISKQTSLKVKETNLTEIAHLIIRPILKTPVRLRKQIKTEKLSKRLESINDINTFLKTIEKQKIIMSSEAFSFFRTPLERELLQFMLRDFNVIPIIFLRDKKTWMKSWYTQTIPIRKKMNLLDDKNLPQDGVFNFSEDSWLVDDEKIVDLYGDNSIVFSYEECLEKYNSVVPCFLSALNISLNNCPSWQNTWENSSKDKPKTLT